MSNKKYKGTEISSQSPHVNYIGNDRKTIPKMYINITDNL